LVTLKRTQSMNYRTWQSSGMRMGNEEGFNSEELHSLYLSPNFNQID
jgi:hypothetical protein